MDFVFELVKYHTYGAMDDQNLIDLPAFKLSDGKGAEKDTLVVFDATRKETLYVEATPGTGKGQYTPA